MRVAFRTLIGALALSAAPLAAFAQSEAEPTAETPEAPSEPAAEPGEDRVVRAAASDLRAGAEVRDVRGGLVGRIQSADADSAIVSTGRTRVRLPLSSFGRNRAGLVISLSRTELEAAAARQSGG